MQGATTWDGGRSPSFGSDVWTFAFAVVLHVGALVWARALPDSVGQGPRLIDAPELEMVEVPESEEAEPEPEPEVEAEPEPEPEPPRVVPEPAVPTAEENQTPDPPAEVPETEVAPDPVATEDVVVDESSDSRAFSIRRSKTPTKGVARGRLGVTKKRGKRARKRRALISRPPKYPRGLPARVLRNYPRHALAEGVEGEVVVHVELDVTGRVQNVQVQEVSDDGWGFGEACARSVHELPQWRPKLKLGKPSGGVTIYVCRFTPPPDLAPTVQR